MCVLGLTPICGYAVGWVNWNGFPPLAWLPRYTSCSCGQSVRVDKPFDIPECTWIASLYTSWGRYVWERIRYTRRTWTSSLRYTSRHDFGQAVRCGGTVRYTSKVLGQWKVRVISLRLTAPCRTSAHHEVTLQLLGKIWSITMLFGDVVWIMHDSLISILWWECLSWLCQTGSKVQVPMVHQVWMGDACNTWIYVTLGAHGVKCTWRIFYKCVNRSISMGYTWKRGTCKNGGAYKQI